MDKQTQETTPAQSAAKTTGRLRRVQNVLVENRFEYALLIPALALIIGILWVPFLRGIWMSFHEWPVLGPNTWVGLGNYEFLFSWDAFYTGIRATLIYGLIGIPQLVIAIVAALCVKHQKRLSGIAGSVILIPYTLPAVVTGTIWLYLLNPDFGPVFGYLMEWGILDQPLYWASDGDLAMATISFVGVWSFWPFMFIIILASLENIPSEYYESAKVYGANRAQMFAYITLPQIKSSILVAFIIRTIWNLSKVSQPLQMTGGGPGYDTSVLAVLLYNRATVQGDMGLSFAIGIVLLLGTLVLVLVFIREFEREAKNL